MKVYVDPARRQGHAICFGRAPEAFEFVALEDVAVVRESAEITVSIEVFRAAARECPERAILVEEDQ